MSDSVFARSIIMAIPSCWRHRMNDIIRAFEKVLAHFLRQRAESARTK